MTKRTPDDRDRFQQLTARAKAAEENMQAIIDRVEERRQRRRERASRGFFRRLFSP